MTDTTIEIYDVIVVGAGGAGLMAALEAARLGCRTLLLEKEAHIGGTTAMSVGTVCTTGTDLQRARGIVDSTEAHFEDLGKFAGDLVSRDNLELRRLLVENIPEAYRRLREAGVQFMGPIPEPPHREPRLHAIVPHSRGYIHHLTRALRRAGGTILTSTPVRRLTQMDGRVTGVEIETGGQMRTLAATRGVILTTGDLSGAPRAYQKRFFGEDLLVLDAINPASTGDGHALGEEAGGEVVNGDLATGPQLRFLAPPKTALVNRLPPIRLVGSAVLTAMKILPDPILRPMLMSFVTTFLAPYPGVFRQGAVLINRNGQRFCDELSFPEFKVADQPQQHAFIVFDKAVADKLQAWPNFISTAPGVGYAYLRDYERSRRDIFYKADSWQELGRKVGIDGAALSEAIENYNAALPARSERPKLLKPPFYALGPAKPWIVHAEGGLRVDTSLRVLDRKDSPVPGLYAAGSAGQGGVLLEGHGHHLGWAFASGMLAGAAVARESARTAQQAIPVPSRNSQETIS
ncbi:FAD-binding protein [Pseudorhizobium halotolerans]|uniref:FAD-binding protein n=1 Tax=Pseudorhizobium halotolerans TaxID=1233081 RepID=A0ABM8PX22_9HYPH|nr:FAD-dependent oxidoreductase [Pseudorhizobium halotolerans]CAD7053241.1 FAD-binding protein [Pseudorhizobium halotolerans]